MSKGQFVTRALTVPATQAVSSTPTDVSDLEDMIVATSGATQDSTETIHGSVDGTYFVPIATGITAAGVTVVPGRWALLKIETTTAGNVRPTMAVSGAQVARG